MCNSSLPLVAWIDGELPESEASVVEQHIKVCADCQKRHSAYEGASRGFAAYYAATTQAVPVALAEAKADRRVPRWIPIALAAAAAAITALVLLPRTQKHAPPAPQVVAKAVVPVAVDTSPKPVEVAPTVKRPAKPRTAARMQPVHEDWAIAQPGIQIAIPADAMFPPGAMPEGAAYIANVSFAADGSVQGIRLRP